MKFVPVTVSKKLLPPSFVLLGDKLVNVGTGLDAAAFTVKFTAAETPPPGTGLNTVTGIVAALARSTLMIDAVNCVGLT